MCPSGMEEVIKMRKSLVPVAALLFAGVIAACGGGGGGTVEVTVQEYSVAPADIRCFGDGHFQCREPRA